MKAGGDTMKAMEGDKAPRFGALILTWNEIWEKLNIFSVIIILYRGLCYINNWQLLPNNW